MELPSPTIIVDCEYGQHVDDIDVNMLSLHRYLQSRGLNSEQIDNTSIHLSSEHKQRYGKRLLGSCYKANPELVSVYCLPDLQYAAGRLAVNTSFEYAEQRAERHIATTLVHEIEHRAIWTQPRSGEKTAFIEQVAMKLSEIGDGDTTGLGEWVYKNDPDEARCRAVEDSAPTDLIRIRLKRS